MLDVSDILFFSYRGVEPKIAYRGASSFMDLYPNHYQHYTSQYLEKRNGILVEEQSGRPPDRGIQDFGEIRESSGIRQETGTDPVWAASS